MASILKYFTSNKTSTGKEVDAIFLSLSRSIDRSIESYGVSNENIIETIRPAEKAKRITYKEKDKMKITKYANLYGRAKAVRQYSKEFPNISESTVRGWLKKVRGELTLKIPSDEVVI